MLPLKIVIGGDYWDCQLYHNRLFLWTMNGSLEIYDWGHLINSVPTNDHSLIEAVFTGAHVLYRDPGNRETFANRLRQASPWDGTWEISPEQLEGCRLAKIENPFGILPVDTDMNWGHAYGATDNGLLIADVKQLVWGHSKSIRQVESLWEERVYSARVRHGLAALAVGEKGLCMMTLPHRYWPRFLKQSPPPNWEQVFPGLERLTKEVIRLSNSHCSDAYWANASVYGVSNAEQRGMLAAFTPSGSRHKPRFSRLYSETQIFDRSGVTWACGDRIYLTTPNGLQVVRFDPRYLETNEEAKVFERLEHIPFQERKGALLAGGAAHFGVVVDCEEALVVIRSDGERPYNIYEGAARWRVYPWSREYCNQLHAIFEDRVELLSFNHDYFVPQKTKTAGIRYRR